MKTTLLLASASLLFAPVAMAATTAATQDQPAQSAAADKDSNAGAHASMRNKVAQDLQNAGFSHVRVVPDGYLVRAKDKSGNPVIMLINPDSITEMVAQTPAATPAAAGTAGNEPAQASDASANQPTFLQLPTSDDMSSKVVGLDVYNQQHQDIGTIHDIAYQGHRIQAYIIGVGGFLGMGDRYVAVNPAAVQISYDHNAKAWHAAMNTTADQLKSAPQYTYPSQG